MRTKRSGGRNGEAPFMPRKPLEPDDRLRNCLPMASGRGGTTREPVKKGDLAQPTASSSGAGPAA